MEYDWISYHRVRNETSRVYDQQEAEEVYQVAKQYLTLVIKLKTELEAARNGD